MIFSTMEKALDGVSTEVSLDVSRAVDCLFEALGAPVQVGDLQGNTGGSDHLNDELSLRDEFYINPGEACSLLARYARPDMGNLVRRETSMCLRGVAREYEAVDDTTGEVGPEDDSRAGTGTRAPDTDFLALASRTKKPHVSLTSIGGQSAMFGTAGGKRGAAMPKTDPPGGESAA